MLEGKVKPALRLLCQQDSLGVLPINEETKQALLDKHPRATHADESILLHGPKQNVNPILYDELTSSTIQKVALLSQGSAGPSGGDADHWRCMCLSFRGASDTLCTAVASVARRISTELVDPGGLQPLLNNRLIPLDKNPGIRPIGVGEALRRIVGNQSCA